MNSRRHEPNRPRRSAAIALCILGALTMACASGCKSNRRPSMPASQRSIAAAIDKAKEAQEAKDPNRAVVLYREAVEMYPEFAAAWNNLGNLHMEQKHYLDAAAAFANAAEFAPSDPRPLFNLGLTWDRAGWPNDALRFYKQALQRDPRYLPALRGAVRAERLLQLAEPDTLERIKLALAQETDEKWRTYLMFQRGNVEQELFKNIAPKNPPASADEVPPGGMYPVGDIMPTAPPPPPPAPK